MPHKDQRETIKHMYQSTTNQERNQHPCKMTIIFLLPAFRHDNHDTTHIKTKHTTHAAPSDMSTTTHHSSRSTALRCHHYLSFPFLQRHDHRCSSLQLFNPICCCGLGSCCTFLPAFNPSLSNPFYPPSTQQHHYSWLYC